MRYFNKHRRGLMKQGYKVGTRVTAQGNASKLELESTLALPPSILQIQGSTEQNQYNGHNLLDVNNYNIDPSGCLLFDISNLEIGAKYTIASNKPLSWLKISTSKSGYNSVQLSKADTGFTSFTFTMARHSSIAENKTQHLILGTYERVNADLPLGDITDISQLDGYEIQIVAGAEAKPYEPYVGGAMSPNPNYPQPIEATRDFKLSAVGSNLFDIDKVKGCDKWTSTDPDGVGLYSYGSKLSDGSLQPKMGVYGAGSIWTGAKIPIKQGGDYFLSCEVKIDSTIILTETDMTFGLRNHTKSRGYRTNGTYVSERDEWVKINLGCLTVPDDWVGDDVYLSTQIMGNSTQFTNLPIYVRNIMLTYGEHTEYENYSECEVQINNIELLGIENAIDALTVDYSSKKVFKTERVLYARVSDLIDEYGAEFDGNGAIYISGALPRMDAPENQIPYFCTHFNSYQSDLTINEENPCFEITASGQIWFYYPPKRTALEFKEWCAENDVRIAYALLNERQIDMTNSECGKSLLSFALPRGKAVAFEIKSEITPKSIDVEYYSTTKEDKCSLTVHYRDTECKSVSESNEYFVRRDSVCQIMSPKIDGYEPHHESTFVYSSNDTEITLIYNKK